MVSSTDRTVLGFYKPDLDAAYRTICKDTNGAFYDQLDENAFRQYLRDHYTLSRVPLTNAWGEMIKNAFVEFLAGGFNCPGASPYKQDLSAGQTMHVASRPGGTPTSATVAVGIPAISDEGRTTGEFFISDEMAREIDSQVSGLPQSPEADAQTASDAEPMRQTIGMSPEVQGELQRIAAGISERPLEPTTREMPIVPAPGAQAGRTVVPPAQPPPLPRRPSPAHRSPAPATPSSSAPVGRMTDEAFIYNLQLLQAEVGNVHIAALTNLRSDAPADAIYSLALDDGKLFHDIVTTAWFDFATGGIIVKVRIFGSDVDRFVDDLSRLADEYNEIQIAQLEHLFTADPSVDEKTRQRIGQEITRAREIASMPPPIVQSMRMRQPGTAPSAPAPAEAPTPVAPPAPAAIPAPAPVVPPAPAPLSYPAAPPVPVLPPLPSSTQVGLAVEGLTQPTPDDMRQTMARFSRVDMPVLRPPITVDTHRADVPPLPTSPPVPVRPEPPAPETPPPPPAPAPAAPAAADSVASRETRILPARDEAPVLAAPALPPIYGESPDELLPVEERLSAAPASPPGGARVVFWGHERSQVTGMTEPLQDVAPARPVASPLPAQRPPAVGPSQEAARASSPPAAPATDPVIARTSMIRSEARQVSRAVRQARKPAELLSASDRFVNSYLDLMSRLNAMILGMTTRSASGFYQMPEYFSAEEKAAIFSFANLTDAFASEVVNALDAALPKKPKKAEHAFIMAEMQLIAELRRRVTDLSAAINPASSAQQMAIRQMIEAFREELADIVNPITWSERVLVEMKKFKKFASRMDDVSVTVKGEVSAVVFDRPELFRLIIERMMVGSARFHWRDVKLNLEWNERRRSTGDQGELVVSSQSNSLRRFRRDRNVSSAVSQLGGRWDLPGRWGRFWRSRFSVLRRTALHRLMLPIPVSRATVNGSGTLSPPPPPARSSGASSEGVRVLGLAETVEAETSGYLPPGASEYGLGLVRPQRPVVNPFAGGAVVLRGGMLALPVPRSLFGR